MDYEGRLHAKNQRYYWMCVALLLVGIITLLYGINTLPVTIPQQNSTTYMYDTSPSQQQTDLRNYQINSVPFKIALGGTGIIILSIILILVRVRNTSILIDLYEKKAALRQRQEEVQPVHTTAQSETIETPSANQDPIQPVAPRQPAPRQPVAPRQPAPRQPAAPPRQPVPRQPAVQQNIPLHQTMYKAVHFTAPSARPLNYKFSYSHMPDNYRVAYKSTTVYPSNI